MLIACTIASLFSCPLGGAHEPAFELLPPLSLAPAQGTVIEQGPRGFVSLGAHYVDGDFATPQGEDPDAGEGFGLDAGLYTWNGELGLALEAGILKSEQEAEASSLANEDVETTRFLLGVRVADRGTESAFLTYLRAGFLMRKDEGDTIDDDGTGWYFGGGFDWTFAGAFNVGPQLLYTDSSSLDAAEWIFGLTFGLRW